MKIRTAGRVNQPGDAETPRHIDILLPPNSRYPRHMTLFSSLRVILAPPMLDATPWPQRHPLAGSDWVQAPQELADFLFQLDQDSRPLEEWLALASTRRLGRYYERLWQFAVQHAPGETLGELDLLLRDREGVHHVELAIKLYLGPQDGDGARPEHWLGPGSNDRLDRKLTHLSQHQLPMSARPESRATLAGLGVEAFSAELWLGGLAPALYRASLEQRAVRRMAGRTRPAGPGAVAGAPESEPARGLGRSRTAVSGVGRVAESGRHQPCV